MSIMLYMLNRLDQVLVENHSNPSMNDSYMDTIIPKKLVICYCKFQPPTKAHQEMIDKVGEVANREACMAIVIPSYCGESGNNPLTFNEKREFIVPLVSGSEHSFNLSISNAKSSLIKQLKSISSRGYNEIIHIVPHNKVSLYENAITPLIGGDGLENITKYSTETIGFDPDSDNFGGISCEDILNSVKLGDEHTFIDGMSKHYNYKLMKEMWFLLRERLVGNK